MVGLGVLRECLLDPDVESVVTVGRAPTGQKHEKLRELVHANLLDLSAIEGELSGHKTLCEGTARLSWQRNRMLLCSVYPTDV
jgi:hypothetical protein